MARNHDAGRAHAPDRCPEPRVRLPDRGAFLGVAWASGPGAADRMVAARVQCEPDRARLTRLWRPLRGAGGRRGLGERLAAWLAEECQRADGRLVVGIDLPLSLCEIQLRQLGLLRQAIAGPASLGAALAARYLPAGGDPGLAAEGVRGEIGRERSRATDGYRCVPPPGPRSGALRRTVGGIVALAGVEASFLPWDRPQAGRPTLLEVYPPHVPRALAGIRGYRDGEGEGRPSLRAAVLRRLRGALHLAFEVEQAAEIVADGTGASLDAVLGAAAAASAAQGGFVQVPHDVPRSEGWIYSIPEEPWRR